MVDMLDVAEGPIGLCIEVEYSFVSTAENALVGISSLTVSLSRPYISSLL